MKKLILALLIMSMTLFGACVAPSLTPVPSATPSEVIEPAHKEVSSSRRLMSGDMQNCTVT
jgi:hypothetical protein